MQHITCFCGLYGNESKDIPAIIEPVNPADEVYLVRNGVVYKWDKSATEPGNDLEHFTATTLTFSEIKLPTVDEKLTEFMKNVKYLSNAANPYKTEQFIIEKFIINNDQLKYVDLTDITLKDINVRELVDWIYNIKPEYIVSIAASIKDAAHIKDIKDPEIIKQYTTAALTLNITMPAVNTVLYTLDKIKQICEKLAKAKSSPVAPQATPQANP